MKTGSPATRRWIVEALLAANVPRVSSDPQIMRFIDGLGDVELRTLDLDSLGTMEFCIHIEVNHGISIVPDSIRDIATLGQLAEKIEETGRAQAL